MPTLDELPDSVTRAGLEFNYAVWTPNTTVTLATVPWHSDYRDLVAFAGQAPLDQYLARSNGPTVQINAVTYLRAGQPVRLNIPFGNAMKYNYMRVHNPAQPVPGSDVPKTLYYFILDVNHVAPNTTEFVVMLDVWQTFGRQVAFGRCYVQRGHVGIANVDADKENGRRFLTVPEGLDTGGQLAIAASKYIPIAHPSAIAENPNYRAGVLMVSTLDIQKSGGTMDNPTIATATGDYINGMPSGANMYYFTEVPEFMKFMLLHQELPWVTQGIIGLYLVPQMYDPNDVGAGKSLLEVKLGPPGSAQASAYKIMSFATDLTLVTGSSASAHYAWRSILLNSIPKRYRHLTKFLTHPYSSVQFTTFTGQPLAMKPELLNGPTLKLVSRFYTGVPNPRVAIQPEGYNNLESGKGDLDYATNFVQRPGTYITTIGEDLDFATTISSFPQLALVNNGYMSYMASNAASIPYQYQSAEWSQQRALMGANTASQNVDRANLTNKELTDIGNTSINMQRGINNLAQLQRTQLQGAQGVMGSVGSLNAMGAISSVYGAVESSNINSQQINDTANLQMGIADDRYSASAQGARAIGDNNLAYAKAAAEGDYENTIAGLNARVQDTKMIQPTTSGQISGEAFSYVVHNGFKGCITVKRIDNNALASIGEYWLRYGYAVNRFHKLTNLLVMQNFTYWKLAETNLLPESNCPQNYRNTIRGIFEKGVTVWRNPDDINNLDIGSNPIAGSGVAL